MAYAIAFDMDTDVLKQTYQNASWQNAYGDIKKVLEPLGFKRQQGSVYFGDETTNAVTCTLAAMTLTQTYAWFAASVTDIRMLRIEEMNDLKPIIAATQKATQGAAGASPKSSMGNASLSAGQGPQAGSST